MNMVSVLINNFVPDCQTHSENQISECAMPLGLTEAMTTSEILYMLFNGPPTVHYRVLIEARGSANITASLPSLPSAPRRLTFCINNTLSHRSAQIESIYTHIASKADGAICSQPW